MEALNAELDRLAREGNHAAVNGVRRDAVGSGERSDKRRTVRFQADQVIDHLTGKTMTTGDYMRGHMDRLW